jgi:hypothetical protein
VAHQLLGDLQARLPGHVVAECVAQRVRADLHRQAGAAPDPLDELVEPGIGDRRVDVAQRPAIGRDAAPARQHEGAGRDEQQDLSDDRLELGQDRHPALAVALGDVRAHVDEAGPGEVLAAQQAHLLTAQAGEHAEMDRPALPWRLGRGDQADDLLAGRAVDRHLAGLGAADHPRRVGVTDALLHAPVVEAGQHGVRLALGVRVLPAAQGALDVVAAGLGRVTLGDVHGVGVELRPIGRLGVRRVDPTLGAAVGHEQVHGGRELQLSPGPLGGKKLSDAPPFGRGSISAP